MKLKFPWWAVGLAAMFVSYGVMFFVVDGPVRAFKGDDTCYVHWDGRSNPVVCD